MRVKTRLLQGQSWSWSYGTWIDNHLCNQCRSPLTLWVWIPLTRGVLDTTFCDKVCQWLATDRWFFSGTLVPPPITESDCHDITEILLKVVLNTINLTQTFYCVLAILQWKYLKAMWLAIISWMWILEANIKVCFHYKMTAYLSFSKLG